MIFAILNNTYKVLFNLLILCNIKHKNAISTITNPITLSVYTPKTANASPVNSNAEISQDHLYLLNNWHLQIYATATPPQIFPTAQV